MSSRAQDRGLLSILLYPFLLLYRLILRLLGFGVDPITILAPRGDDHVKPMFTVEGTTGAAASVTVKVTGAASGSLVVAAVAPYYEWSASFFATGTGSCTAEASAPGASLKSVTFVVDSAPLVELDPPPVLEDDPPITVGTTAAKKSGYVKFTGNCPDTADIDTFEAYLEQPDETHTQIEKIVTPKNAGKKFKDKFKKQVKDGVFVVHVFLKHKNGKKAGATRIVVAK